MNNPDFRAMCAELVDAWASGKGLASSIIRAVGLLDQQEPEGPTDDELLEAFDGEFAEFFDSSDGFGTTAIPRSEWTKVARAVIARYGRPPSDTESLRSALRECGRAVGLLISDECSDEFLLQVPAEVRLALTNTVWADIHYAWELHDAEGEWQAGGSANSLEDVRREGDRYLQTYSEDGPHKLIIQRHCVTTINEVTQ